MHLKEVQAAGDAAGMGRREMLAEAARIVPLVSDKDIMAVLGRELEARKEEGVRKRLLAHLKERPGAIYVRDDLERLSWMIEPLAMEAEYGAERGKAAATAGFR